MFSPRSYWQHTSPLKSKSGWKQLVPPPSWAYKWAGNTQNTKPSQFGWFVGSHLFLSHLKWLKFYFPRPSVVRPLPRKNWKPKDMSNSLIILRTTDPSKQAFSSISALKQVEALSWQTCSLVHLRRAKQLANVEAQLTRLTPCQPYCLMWMRREKTKNKKSASTLTTLARSFARLTCRWL